MNFVLLPSGTENHELPASDNPVGVGPVSPPDAHVDGNDESDSDFMPLPGRLRVVRRGGTHLGFERA